MKSEVRMYQASIRTGITELLIVAILLYLGLSDVVWETLRVFGSLGIGMIIFGLHHRYLYKIQGDWD